LAPSPRLRCRSAGATPCRHQWYGLLLAYLGRPAEAAQQTAVAARLDPLSVQINNMLGAMLSDAGDTQGALRQFERTVNAEPDSAWVRENPWVLSNYGSVAADAGRHEQAVRLIERALQVVPSHPRPLLDLARVYLRVNDTASARAAFARADTANPQYAMYRGLFHASLGEIDSAFAWLDRVHDWSLPALITLNSSHGFGALRADPRYGRIRARLGMPPH
jgi:tetratricopeptide (TPR) repeat protein